MKKYTLFETSIIGLFIGVIVATYSAYLNSSGAFVGKVLSWVTLSPLLGLWHSPLRESLVVQFIFIVLVFAIYGVILGLLFRVLRTAKYIVILVVLILLASIFEQSLTKADIKPDLNAIPVIATAVRALPKVSETPQQYFGNEVVGDLNADGKNDVAFVISREDPERGVLYYLTTALSDDKGHTGTNLIYLGEKMDPKSLNIIDGKIGFEFMDLADKNATTTKFIYAGIVQGKLVQMKYI
jgi:hypothetical protein